MRMSVDLRDLFLYEAFLYYNPLLLVVSLFYLIFHFLSTIGLYTCFFPCISMFCFAVVMQTMMVWLWGVNLWVFSQTNVNYAKIFELEQNHLTYQEIWKVPRCSACGKSLQLCNTF